MSVDILIAAGEPDLTGAKELISRSFGPDYRSAKLSLERHLEIENRTGPGRFVVALADGDIVGTVRMLPKSLYVNGNELPAVGITHVCVHPDWQGRLVATRLLNFAHEIATGEGCILAVTFGRRAVDGFYPRFGYLGVGNHFMLQVGPIADAPSIADDIVVSKGLNERLLSGNAHAYEATYRSLPLAFVRASGWWEAAPIRLGGGSFEFFNVGRRDTPVGYFIRHDGRVVEAAAEPGAAGLLAAAILRTAVSTGAPTLCLRLPATHPILPALMRNNHTGETRLSWDGGHMIKVLDGRVFFGLFGFDAKTDLKDLFLPGDGRPALHPTWSPIDEF